ncbi:STAS/SEC14 domain-containing protein [Thalassovita mangrovi]|uniref:STAS/SEC14 domain-containing protein n=1 Tax=Thalassovita mangrovi TaxID=2692236 RepID=A0A6L8LMK7_9RHOB|nr:STAS/SEC14 domain-containing protein [Thalassovita mangrovi]MYM57115.1 STAS/SEC14 domain-containing protein [Thalassovita mangrovi]
MIEFMEGSEGATVGLRVTGKLHEQDYAELLPKLEALFAEHGKLRILFYADPDFQGWDMSAAWQDAALGFRHASDFERMAMVGAPDWVDWCVRLSAFLFKGEVRIFEADQLDEAWTWIRG